MLLIYLHVHKLAMNRPNYSSKSLTILLVFPYSSSLFVHLLFYLSECVLVYVSPRVVSACNGIWQIMLHCCNVHVLQIPPSSETPAPAASQTIGDEVNSYPLFFTPYSSAPTSFTFSFQTSGVNSLTELWSASNILAPAGESLRVVQHPNRKVAGTNTFFRSHSFAIDILWDHSSTLTFALLCRPEEVNEGPFTLHHHSSCQVNNYQDISF